MRRILLTVGLLTGVAVIISQTVFSQSEPKKSAKPDEARAEDKPTAPPDKDKDRSADEKAIRANVAAFERAYNVGDAKAIAALFTAEAMIMGKDGDASQGRDAIRDTFANLFKETPQRRIEIIVDSIRFVGPDLAVETGTTKETAAPGEPPERDAYTVLHVKRDGKWLMAVARETEGDPPSGHEQLKPLAWLVGDWIDDDGKVAVRSVCRWSPDKNFLLQEFDMQIEGKNAMKVSQRIGWDPLAKRIRSWTFDSEGGFGESVWTQDGNTWIIKATGVRPDGSAASATNFLVPAGKDGYVWRSTDRIVGDDVVPPTEVKVVRKPPQPK